MIAVFKKITIMRLLVSKLFDTKFCPVGDPGVPKNRWLLARDYLRAPQV